MRHYGAQSSKVLMRHKGIPPMKMMRENFGDPPSLVFEVAQRLNSAVDAHISGEVGLADALIREADIPELGEWLDPIWLRKSEVTKAINVDGLPPVLPKDQRDAARMPKSDMKRALIARDGHHCQFCSMPLVRAEVRKEICRLYPDAARWTSTRETDQHRGLQVLWLQYDHLMVHSRGGATNLENMVIACVACNFGRDRYTLEEMRFLDPRTHTRTPAWFGAATWDGLERILPKRSQRLAEMA